jgi:hypothetical protein
MKYELYLLNNIHDAIDMVNVELDPFLDLVMRENHYDTISIKHIIINLANCCELLVKFRLEEEHWVFIFSDMNKASFESYKNGDFVSVDFKAGISRIQNIIGIKYDFSACKHIYQYRNNLMHYTLNNTYECILKDISGAMCEIVEFVNNEIVNLLPTEATEDFAESMNEYIKNAKGIDETVSYIK